MEHQVDCTGAFSQVHGMPCSHKMKAIRNADSVLQVNDFDAHGHLARAQPPHLPVMSSFHESIARLQERHANLSPSEQSILQNEIDRLMENQISIKDHVPIATRGRSVGSRGSTKRDLSAFEYVELQGDRIKSQRCGTYHQIGHNKRT